MKLTRSFRQDDFDYLIKSLFIEMERPKLRILCLHGRGQNKRVMQKNIQFLQKVTGDLAEYECVDGGLYYPFAAVRSQPPFYSWVDIENLQNQELHLYALKFFIKIWNSGKYDGILGFSQGAWISRLALLFMRQGKLKLDYMPKFLLLSGLPGYGYRPIHGIVSIPSILLVGEDDFLCPDAKNWTAHFTNPSLLYHPGTHHPPRSLTKTQVTYIKSFLKGFLPKPSL